MASKVRPRKAAVALLHPETGVLVVPNPEMLYSVKDPLVKTFPWAFVSDDELQAELVEAARAWPSSQIPVEPVEQATAAPGEKRVVNRAAAKKAD